MRSRIVDWFIGAFAMLVIIAIALTVMWFQVTEPIDETTPPRSTPSQPGQVPPPDDLGPDEIWLADVNVRSGTLELPETTLEHLQALGAGVRSTGETITVEHLDVRATVPFDDVARQMGGDSVVRPAGDGKASVERTVEVLGRSLRVEATGTVTVRDGLIVVEPTSIQIPLVGSSNTAADLVREFVTIEYPIEGLPENLELRGIDIEQAGFQAHLSGDDVVLSEA